MGVVWEAEDTLLQRRVAIKVLAYSSAADPGALRRLLREAQAVARLSHPNVVAVHHVGQWEGGYYLVLERMRGSLQGRLGAEGPLPWPEATRAVAEACRGLGAAHDAGFIHRDIKPSNLMDNEAGAVKVGDFGLVRGGDFTASGTGVLTGTPHYMSPEQCRGEPADERSDLYALGATYFALLTGRPPYLGDEPMAVMFAHCTAPVPDPRRQNPDVPEACAVVVRKAMAKEPADRYQSVAELLAALEALGSKDGADAGTHTDLPPVRRVPGRRWSVAAACLGLVLLAGGVAIFRPRSADPPPAPPPGELTLPGDPAYAAAGGESIPAQMPRHPPQLFDPALPAGGCVIRLGGKVRAVAFSPDGRLFAAATAEPVPEAQGHPTGVVVWEWASGRVVEHLWREHSVPCLAFSAPKRQSLVRGGEDGAIEWYFKSREENAFCAEGWGAIGAAAFSADESRSAVGFSGGLCCGMISEWKFPGGITGRKPGRDLCWPPVRQLLYSAYDRALAAAYANGDVRLWLLDETMEKRPPALPTDGSPVALTFAPGRPVLTLAADGEVRHWAYLQSIWVGKSFRTGGKVQGVLYTADEQNLVAAGPGQEVRFWEVPTGKPVHTLRGHRHTVLSLALSPDGRVLATGDEAGEVRLWDVRRALSGPREGPP
jgi:hypothetical protein